MNPETLDFYLRNHLIRPAKIGGRLELTELGLAWQEYLIHVANGGTVH